MRTAAFGPDRFGTIRPEQPTKTKVKNLGVGVGTLELGLQGDRCRWPEPETATLTGATGRRRSRAASLPNVAPPRRLTGWC
jgi:hypothetical protein